MGKSMYFTDEQSVMVRDLVAKIEERTGIELVAAVVGKCDNYPEIPWKAFALAVSLTALALLVAAFAFPGCAAVLRTPLSLLIVMGAGALAAIVSVFCPFFGRLFLDRARAETEVDQFARVLFLERGMFAACGRTGVLVLAGLFERRVVIVPDSGISARLGRKALDTVIDRMRGHLRGGGIFQAFVAGLGALEAELVSAGFVSSGKKSNEVDDAVVQQKGADR